MNPGRWPLDLTIFAVLSVIWSAVLVAAASVNLTDILAVYASRAVFAGILFKGVSARIVMLAQAPILSLFAIAILMRRRWGLVLALFYLGETVLSLLVFVAVNAGKPVLNEQVRHAAIEGPIVVLVLLYLWIRSKALLFDREMEP